MNHTHHQFDPRGGQINFFPNMNNSENLIISDSSENIGAPPPSPPTEQTESDLRFVPILHQSQNPLQCCNVKLSKALQFLAILFIIIRAAIFTVYFYISLNTVTFVTFYADYTGATSVLQYTHGIRITSTLLWMKEVLFIFSTFFLLFFGAYYRKYAFLKSWAIFTSLHETLSLLAHLAIGICMSTSILAYHLPLTLPFLALLFHLCLNLMGEIKQKQIQQRETGPRLKLSKTGTKAKDLLLNNRGDTTTFPSIMAEVAPPNNNNKNFMV